MIEFIGFLVFLMGSLALAGGVLALIMFFIFWIAALNARNPPSD